ncbi:MAG: RNase J family beta-CASP ribonuclease [Clostridia bacterium]|nr:RNase J family beta-CASP ribonuclease [Clostridia bacterium]
MSSDNTSKKNTKNIGKQKTYKQNKSVAQKKATNPKTQKKNIAPKKNTAKKNTPQKQSKIKKPLRIIPLGGIGEIGKNITVYEYEKDIILVDCGMSFPDEEMPGIDIVIPDFSYLVQNKERIQGLFVTHGHEDHIGAIPYLLREINVPIYATRLTIGLVEGKLKEHKLLGGAKLNVVNPGETVVAGKFNVEFIHVNHSIPNAVAFAIKTPAGVVIQTGDFKIDTTPIDDKVIDLSRFAKLGSEGVLALLSDSTNAERPGYTASEKLVGESFATLFRKAGKNRIIVATFSSNIHRIQQIIDAAVSYKRKVAVSGRSMLNVVSVASELGYLNVPDNVLIDIESIKKYSAEQLVIITTGSQGEPLSALHRMAYNDHRNVDIVPNDMIIISATPIPGNEKLVGKVVNELMKRGADVVYEKMYDVHVSGHACQEELKLMLSLVKPKYFIPVHGEQKHLYKHALLAKASGIDKDNILMANIGDVIELGTNGIKKTDTVTAGSVLVDGLGVGDVGAVVLKDRKHLSDHGIIVVTFAMDTATREVISGPEIVTRGFVYAKESEELLNQIKEVAEDAIERCYIQNIRDYNTIRSRVRDSVSRYLYENTRRSPMILPIILEV